MQSEAFFSDREKRKAGNEASLSAVWIKTVVPPSDSTEDGTTDAGVVSFGKAGQQPSG